MTPADEQAREIAQPIQRTLQWSLRAGYLLMTWPDVVDEAEAAEIREVLGITIAGIERRAALREMQGETK